MPHTAAFFSQQLTFSSHNDFPVSADAGIDIYLFNSNNIDSEQLTALAAQYLHPWFDAPQDGRPGEGGPENRDFRSSPPWWS